MSAGVDLDLNAQQYLQGSAQVIARTGEMDTSLSRLAITAAALGRTLEGASFGKKQAVAMGAFAGAAASAQQSMSGFAATAAVTGQQAGKLENSVRSLGRTFPIGQQAIVGVVSTVNQLGVAAQGSEAKVGSLAKTFIQLQGANGSSATGFATGLIQLQRTFGDRGIDPKKVSSIGDSLTHVSKQVGASAQGALDFANAIAPITQSSGIGKAATVGIGAAFTAIGQDGTAAATAVNRMLSDINKAVRDGGPQLATYADIVGTTASQFERLYKTNPTEALTQITESIGKAGDRGPRILESIGLDGVRTQRSLQALSASGGLRSTIDTAIGSQGDGSTKRASDAAYEGVLDSFQKVANSAQQLAQALGKPLIGPLGIVSKTLATVSGGVASVASSGPGSAVLMAGFAGLIASRLLGAGLTGALVRQVTTSGPVGAALAGYRAGRGQQLETDRFGRPVMGGFMGRTAGGLERAAQDGTLRQGMLGGVRGFVYDTARGLGESRGPAGPGGGGPGMLQRAGSAVWGVGVAGVRGYTAMNTAALGAAARPAMDRENYVRRQLSIFGGGVSQFGRDVVGSARGFDVRDPANSLRRFSTDTGAAFRTMTQQVNATNRVFPNLIRGMGAFSVAAGRLGGQAAVGVGGLAASGVGLLGRGIRSFGSMFGLTAAIGGIGYLANRTRKSNQEAEEEAQRQRDLSPTSNADAYNESLGRASQNTESFAETMAQNASKISSAVTDMSQAMRVSANDIANAPGGRNAVTYARESNPQTLAASFRQSFVKGADASQVNAFKQDIIRQFGPDVAQQTLDALGIDKQGNYAAGASRSSEDLRTLAGQASGINANVGVGLNSFGADKNKVTPGEYYGMFSSTSKIKLKDSARGIGDTISGSLSQRYSAQNDQFGPEYANQTRFRDINAIAEELAKSGNEAAFNEITDEIARTQLGFDKRKVPRILSTDVQKNGGYLQALAAQDETFRGVLESQQGLGVTLSGPGRAAVPRRNLETQKLLEANSPLASLFDNTLASRMPPPGTPSFLAPQNPLSLPRPSAPLLAANTAVQASIDKPDDRALASTAERSIVQESVRSGQSLVTLTQNLTKAAGVIDSDANPAMQRLIGTLSKVADAAAIRSNFQSSGQSLGERFGRNAALANTKGNSDSAIAAREEGKEGLKQDLADYTGMIKQRLQVQRNYEIQSRRSAEQYGVSVRRAYEDFGVSQSQAAQDFAISRAQAEEDYQKQVFRSNRDFHTQMERQEVDYQTSRSRAMRDYATTSARGEEDMNTQRLRSIRDFNKQIKRQVMDAATALYDPYERIQTQMVWDARSLLANLDDQNAAIAKQSAQLEAVRRAGISNATIQQLGLNDPKNAQQLNQLVQDVMNDPKLAKQLNQATAARQSLGGVLVTDPGNKDIARAKEDFSTTLRDMEADYRKSIARARQDFTKAMADQDADYGKQLARQNADFQKSMADAANDFATSLARQDLAYAISTQRAAEAFNRQMVRMSEDYSTSMRHMQEDVAEAQKEITLSITDLWDTANQLIQNKSVDTNKFMRDGLKDTFDFIKSGDNAKEINQAYKNLFPYDLSKVFGTGGGESRHPDIVKSLLNGVGPGGPVGQWPVEGATYIRGVQTGGDRHDGVDLAIGEGAPIIAPMAGQITLAGWNDGYGNCVVMDVGGGRSMLFGHMVSAPDVKAGQLVAAGTRLGGVGNTGNSEGNHLHFETRGPGGIEDPNVALPRWKLEGSGFQTDASAGDPGEDIASKNFGPWGSFIQMGIMMKNLKKMYPEGYEKAQDWKGKGLSSAEASFSDSLREYVPDWARGPITTYAKQFGVPANLIAATIQAESSFDLYSPPGSDGANSFGLGHFIEAVRPGYPRYRWGDADGQIYEISRLLKQKHERLGDWVAVSRDYNAGNPSYFEDHVQKWLSSGGITRGQVRKGSRGAGEAGREAIIPLDSGHGIQALSDAFRRAISGSELGRMMVNGNQSTVSYTSHHEVHDNSVSYQGANIEIKAEDPNSMERKLQEKRRAGRLTSTGRPRG